MEVWKDIEGYERSYQVSNKGRVRSLDRITNDGKALKGKILCQTYAGKGYLSVMLSKDGKTQRKNIHRLVAEAFLPNPNNLPEINHKSERKNENFVENLEWCDHKYNNTYGGKIERGSKHNKVPVVQCTMDGEELFCWFSGVDAVAENPQLRATSIAACCRGRIKYHKGYKWKYGKEKTEAV